MKQFPLIKVSMTELRAMDLMYNKSKVMLNGNLQKQYLVNKLDILEENHTL